MNVMLPPANYVCIENKQKKTVMHISEGNKEVCILPACSVLEGGGRERSDGWMYRGWMNVGINECAGERMGDE